MIFPLSPATSAPQFPSALARRTCGGTAGGPHRGAWGRKPRISAGLPRWGCSSGVPATPSARLPGDACRYTRPALLPGPRAPRAPAAPVAIFIPRWGLQPPRVAISKIARTGREHYLLTTLAAPRPLVSPLSPLSLLETKRGLTLRRCFPLLPFFSLEDEVYLGGSDHHYRFVLEMY